MMITAQEACNLSHSKLRWLEYEEQQLNKMHREIVDACNKGKFSIKFKVVPFKAFTLENIAKSLDGYGYQVSWTRSGTIEINWTHLKETEHGS